MYIHNRKHSSGLSTFSLHIGSKPAVIGGYSRIVNTRYKHTRYRHNHVIGNKIACTNFPPPKRLRYKH